MITLNQLITVAPFSDDVRQQLLASIPTLTEERQQELAGICWDAILKLYQANYDFTLQEDSLKAATTQDASQMRSGQEVEDALVLDLQKKFTEVGAQVELHEIRHELKTLQNPQS